MYLGYWLSLVMAAWWTTWGILAVSQRAVGVALISHLAW